MVKVRIPFGLATCYEFQRYVARPLGCNIGIGILNGKRSGPSYLMLPPSAVGGALVACGLGLWLLF